MIECGFVGLGNFGGPMARHIAEAGYPLQVWARRPESLDEVAGTAAVVAPDLETLGARSEIVGICVLADDDVIEVSERILAGMASGGILVIHSTVLPETCARVAQSAGARGVSVVDAPGIGGRGGVQDGQVALPCGGEPVDFERCRPVLETFGDPVRWFGPLGSGQLVKLINNFVYYARVDLYLHAAEAAQAMGFDREVAAEILTHDLARAVMTRNATAGKLAPAAIPKTCRILQKDVGHALAVYEQFGIDPEPLAGLTTDVLARLGAIAEASDRTQ